MRNLIKIFSIIILWLAFFGISNAAFDLTIDDISLSNGWDSASLFSNPTINITIANDWAYIAQNSAPMPDWFISCVEVVSQNEVFKSTPMNTFIVNPWTTMIAWNLALKDTLTQTPRTVEINCTVNTPNLLDWTESNASNNSSLFSFGVAKIWRFDTSMDRSIDPIKNQLDAAEPTSLLWWWDSIKNFVFNKIINIITPIVIIVGILIGIIWAYRLFFSTSAEETKKWMQLLIYWVLWIIIILSARYMGTVIFEEMFKSWNALVGTNTDIKWVDLAMQLYERIAYPFIKMITYLALGAMFIVLAGKVFSFITKPDEWSQKKAWIMIAWSAVSMLIIIWAKQIVEAIYGKQADVMNENAQTLWEIWTGILADKSIPLLYSVINWVMWLTSLIVLVIIVFQTFQILTNPDKADNRQRIWKSLIYIFIGILIIGAWYLLTNFLVIN